MRMFFLQLTNQIQYLPLVWSVLKFVFKNYLLLAIGLIVYAFAISTSIFYGQLSDLKSGYESHIYLHQTSRSRKEYEPEETVSESVIKNTISRWVDLTRQKMRRKKVSFNTVFIYRLIDKQSAERFFAVFMSLRHRWMAGFVLSDLPLISLDFFSKTFFGFL